MTHKKIGLLGGMSWESTALYYQLINQGIKTALGGHHSARIILESLDFQVIKQLQHDNEWDTAASHLAEGAKNLARAGADCLLICTNTMHKVADEVAQAVEIPLIHLADATAKKIIETGHDCIGFLGTRFSMEDDFYVGRLQRKHGLTVLVPNEQERKIVHSVIYDELCLGEISEASRKSFLRIIDQLKQQGAQGIIEGCTEITLLVQQKHTAVRLFDTTAIHAAAAVDFALSE